MKFRENCKKIWTKFKRNWEKNFKRFQKNYRNIIRKNLNNSKLMLLIIWKNFTMFFWNNFREIGKKLRRNIRKILKKYRKHFTQTWKNPILIETLEFSRQYLKELMKNFTETSDSFREKLQRNPLKIFGNIWGFLENLWGHSKYQVTCV